MNPSSAGKQIRIAIVEDEPLFRDLLRRACSSCEEIEVWSDFASGEALLDTMDKAIRDEGQMPFDVLLTDIALDAGLNGFQVCYQIRESHPELGILLLSNHCIPAILSKLSTFGMRGFAYLLKTTATDFETLRRAIVAVFEGGIVVDELILAEGRLHHRLGQLTERQTEILHLAAQGYSNTALAEALHLSPRTVENHLAHIYEELGITNDSTIQPRVRAVVMYLSARFPHLMQQFQSLHPLSKGSTSNEDTVHLRAKHESTNAGSRHAPRR